MEADLGEGVELHVGKVAAGDAELGPLSFQQPELLRPTLEARRPGRSLLVGLLVLIAGPLLFLAGIFTLVLLPVTVVTTAVWLFALFVAAVPALVAAGRASDFEEGIRQAQAAIDTGAAVGKLEALIRYMRDGS